MAVNRPGDMVVRMRDVLATPGCILVTRASDRPKALGNSMSRTCALGFLYPKIGYLNLLTPRTNMNEPIRDAFDCSSRKPMTRHYVSGFPRALLSLSKKKSSGVENAPGWCYGVSPWFLCFIFH